MRVKAQNKIMVDCYKKVTLKNIPYLQDRPSCCFAAPDEDENAYLNPSLRGASCATWQSLPST